MDGTPNYRFYGTMYYNFYETTVPSNSVLAKSDAQIPFVSYFAQLQIATTPGNSNKPTFRIRSLHTMKEASVMKRSKTTYTGSNSNCKSFGNHLTQEQRDPMLLNSPRSRKTSLSQANASWVHEPISADSSRNGLCPRQVRNIFLQNDQEINSLLNLLRTNDFSGQLDPKHHSLYMKEPTATLSSKRKPRRLGDKHHLSDGHLLQFKAAPGPLCT